MSGTALPNPVRPEPVEGRSSALATPFDTLGANGEGAGLQVPLRFAGHAALFDRTDRAGDVFRAGAFAGAGPVPLLAQHRGRAVGTLDAVAEDAQGLRIAGEIQDPATAAAVRAGALPGLSVGFRTLASRQGARREIMRAQLVEVSLVAIPMQPGARVHIINEGE